MKRVIYLFVLFFSFSFYGQNDTISNNNIQISKVFIKTKNLIYRGIKNEIFINVPNFESLTASSPGLSIENGRFFIVPTKGIEQKLFLRFKNNDGVFVNEEHIFKIEQIDSVQGVINDKNCVFCVVLIKKKELLNSKISMKIPNHPFIDELEVGGFQITYNSKKNKKTTLKNEGNILSIDNYKILSNLKIGSRFIIHNIYNKSRCEFCSEFISAIQIEIIE